MSRGLITCFFLVAQVEWTKTRIPTRDKDQHHKPAEGARDGDIPEQRQSQGEWKGGRVHSHPSGRISREISITLRFRNRPFVGLKLITEPQDIV